MSPDTPCQCGHRSYDHLTIDGDCWKCPCPRFRAAPVPDDRTEESPR